MKETKTVYLIRHAKCASNLLGRYSGCRSDEDLCDEGIKEAENKKDAIISALPDDIILFSGPMKRAQKTASLLFEDRKIRVVEELSEIDFGDFEGKSASELSEDERYRAWIDSGGTMTFPGGESREEFIERSMEGFWKVLSKVSDKKSALVVCHGGNIMAVMSKLTGLEYFDLAPGTVEGFVITLTIDDERISDITYERFGGGDSA